MSQQYERIMVAIDGSYESDWPLLKVCTLQNVIMLSYYWYTLSIHAPFKALRLSTLTSMKN